MADNIMTPQHPRAAEFLEALTGPEGCNFRQVEGKTTWDCGGGWDKSKSAAILVSMGGIDVAASLAYFDDHGGHCDCEVVFNVLDDVNLPDEIDWAGFLADEVMTLFQQVEVLAAYAKMGIEPNTADEAQRVEILERLRQAEALVDNLIEYYEGTTA